MRADVSQIVSTHERQNLFFYVNTNDNIYFQLWLRALFVDRLTKLNSIKDALICVSTHDVVWLAIAHTAQPSRARLLMCLGTALA